MKVIDIIVDGLFPEPGAIVLPNLLVLEAQSYLVNLEVGLVDLDSLQDVVVLSQAKSIIHTIIGQNTNDEGVL